MSDEEEYDEDMDGEDEGMDGEEGEEGEGASNLALTRPNSVENHRIKTTIQFTHQIQPHTHTTTAGENGEDGEDGEGDGEDDEEGDGGCGDDDDEEEGEDEEKGGDAIISLFIEPEEPIPCKWKSGDGGIGLRVQKMDHPDDPSALETAGVMPGMYLIELCDKEVHALPSKEIKEWIAECEENEEEEYHASFSTSSDGKGGGKGKKKGGKRKKEETATYVQVLAPPGHLPALFKPGMLGTGIKLYQWYVTTFLHFVTFTMLYSVLYQVYLTNP